MATKSEDRLLGLALLALLTALGGDVAGLPLFVAVGVTGFGLAMAALLATMTLTLALGVSRTSGAAMAEAPVSERTR